MNRFRNTSSPSYFDNPKKETYIAIVLAITISLIFGIIFFVGERKPTTIETYTVDIIWNYLIIYGLLFILPVIILLLIRKHSLKTISVQKGGLGTNLAFTSFLLCLGLYFTRFLGYLLFVTPFLLLLWYWEYKTANSDQRSRITHFFGSSRVQLSITVISIIWIVLFVISGGTIHTTEPILSLSSFIGFWATLIQAGSEELMFHGYFQFRAIEWLDEKKGIVLTSIVFSLVHIPMVLASGMSFENIALFLLYIFVSDLPIGYLTYKTHNLTGAVLLHTFANLI